MKRIINTKKFVFFLIITGCWFQIVAKDVTGKLTFTKSADFVMLAYFTEDHSLSKKTVQVDQKAKKFSKKLVVGNTSAEVVFKNGDSVSHNIFAKDTKADVTFDVGLMSPGKDSKIKIDWNKDLIIRIGCKIHPKMRSYIANIDSAFHTIVELEKKKKEVEFSLKDVPDKLTKLRIWFPKYDTVDVEIKVGTTSEVDIKRNGKLYGKILLKR
ncbi:MAG: hypothetical protein COA79_01795 [Planctomycetota bacterium]|nr:MAG: hypothetical protein COA79_01795 [Planctomycetota bacterium]